jgi:hypothetical protein
MTTPDDTAGSWRDLADRLTAAQVAQLERLEQDEPRTLLQLARQWAAENATDAVLFDDVAPPAGAVRTFAWQLDGDGTWFRDFEGPTRRVGQARVHIYGRQQADGSTRRWIAVGCRDLDQLDAAAARELAAALADAADDLGG